MSADADEPPPVRPLLTQRQAADACGVSRSTMRRAREAGRFPNAVLDGTTWMIPVGDLLAAGYRLHAPAPPDSDGPSRDQEAEEADATTRDLERQLHEAQLALAEARGREAAQAARVEELRAQLVGREEQLRDRGDHIETLQRALAALTPAPDRAAIPSPAQPPVDTAPAVGTPAAAVPAGPGRGEAPAARPRRWWSGNRSSS